MTASNPRRVSVADHFQRKIEAAEAEGVSREAMSLHLTLGDVNQLRRDRSLPVATISFAGGVMRFLGVAIVQGGVAVSVLNYPAAT